MKALGGSDLIRETETETVAVTVTGGGGEGPEAYQKG